MLLVAGCAAADTTRAGSPAPPTPPSTTVAELAEERPEERVDDRNGGPCVHDPAETEPFGCVLLVSTGGDAVGVPMSRLASRPLRMRVTPPQNPSLDAGADLALGIATPCNGISVPVARSEDVLTPTAGVVMTPMGCPESDAEDRVLDVVARPMRVERDGSALTLVSGEDTIRFTAEPLPR